MEDREGAQRKAGWWANRSIRTKGLVVLSVPTALLLAVVASTSWFTHVNNRAQAIGGQARQGLSTVATLDMDMLNAVNGVHQYLLSGDASYLSPYRVATATTPGLVESIDTLSQTTPSQQEAFESLRSSSSRLLGDMAELASQAPSSSTSPLANSEVQALIRATQLDTVAFNDAVSALGRVDGVVASSQHDTIHSSYLYVLIIAILATLLAVVAGIVVSQLFTSGVTKRLRALERATLSLEDEGLSSQAPGGSDEIGRVSSRLVAAAAEIRARAEERDGVRRQLEDILTASPVVSLRYDLAARAFSYASPNVRRLLGISSEDAMADPTAVTSRFHPDDAQRLRDVLVEAFRRQQLFRTEGAAAGLSSSPAERVEISLRFRREPESSEWGEAEAIYTLDFNAEGALAGVVAYLVDASDRHLAQRAAEERRSMLETIFHASPDTIVVRDTSGRIILASSSEADVIGVGLRATDRTPTISTTPHEGSSNGSRAVSLSTEDREKLESLTARCVAGEPTPDPVITESKLADGEVRTFETCAQAVLDHEGTLIGTVTVSRDITMRMELEQSLRKASDEAARASEAKSEFLSRMSHELRTPLNAILGFAQLLELDELSSDQSSSVDQIHRAGRHLLSLINEVLDISRIEAGRLSLSAEAVSVREVLDEVTAFLVPAAESAELHLTVTTDEVEDLYVRADRQRLLQVLLNLGSNALKYNERGGSVSFRTWCPSPECVRFEVRDTGPGIPREQQDQLFVPFSRLGAERSGVEGTGVGLALSKQLAELMGGSIGVESVPGHGSTFWVELLATEPALRGSAAVRTAQRDERVFPTSSDGPGLLGGPRAPVSPLSPMASGLSLSSNGSYPGSNGSVRGDGSSTSGVVVLQIEDNESNASLVEQILARRPEVRLFSSPEARLGLELAREYRPDLILLDLHLPDLSGEELLYRLKAVPELAGTKVVVVSADATPSRIRRMLELGVEGYLTKPVDVEALLRLVDLEIDVVRGTL